MMISHGSIFILLAAIFFSICSSLFAASTQRSDPVAARAQDVRALIRDDPKGYDEIFMPTFLKSVPAWRLDAIFTDLHKRLGDCRSIEIGERIGDNAAKVNFMFDHCYVPGTVSVDPGEKHLINGLGFGVEVSLAKNLDEIAAEIKTLPGKTSFLVEKLGGRKPEVLASLNPDQPLAIGSTFKLYLLAELLREIDSSKRTWGDVVRLDAESISLPSGELRKWPVGSPITLHTLAGLMISQSDNTAADQLLRTLGREKVEAILASAGNEHASMNRPFLSTREMFTLHANANLADAFIKGDGLAKSDLLSTKVANATAAISDLGPKPSHIDTIEWFASAADLCRLMDHLRRQTDRAPASEARGILAINPGLDIDKSHFPYIAYKGGSEPGVLNLTYLVRSSKGDWYTLSATWNNPDAALTETDLLSRVTEAFRLLP